MRSELWLPRSLISRSSLPTMGQMMNDQLAVVEDGESQEDMLKRYELDL